MSSVGTIRDYDDAVLNPTRALKRTSPDLCQGQAALITHDDALGGEQEPWRASGGFAVVYRFVNTAGQVRALRFVTGQLPADVAERYRQLGPYFAARLPSITAPFRYFDPADGKGVPVRAPDGSWVLTPLLDMEWIEGEPLSQRVAALCAARDYDGLAGIFDAWRDVLRQLHEHHVAHGDLAAPNILVRPDGRLALVDYDSCYIPSLSGRVAAVAGQAGYRHPRATSRPYDEHMDAFAALVIFTALAALRVHPALWDALMHDRPAGAAAHDTLLFQQEDFEAPSNSAVFRAIVALDDVATRAAAAALIAACAAPPDETPDVLVVADPDALLRTALAALDDAIARDDDAAILAAWTSELVKYPPAARCQPRVERARARRHALADLGQALAADSDEAIVLAADALSALGGSCPSAAAERVALAYQRLGQQRRLLDALRRPDDSALVAVLLEMGPAPIARGQFAAPEWERLERVRRQVVVRHQVETLLAAGDGDAALTLVAEHGLPLDTPSLLQAAERHLTRFQPAVAATRLDRPHLIVQLDWPASPLVTHVAVAWSTLAPAPTAALPGPTCRLIARSDYEQAGVVSVPTAARPPVYVRLFSAWPFRDPATGELVAVFSDGSAPAATACARPPCRVICSLRRPRGARTNTLELRTADQSPLPELVVVRKAGGLPLDPSEGMVVQEIRASTASTRIELDVRGWPPGSVLRVFPTGLADSSWVTIESNQGARLAVT